MNKIVAVVGMCGSGKSCVTEHFVKRGWNRVYFGGVTIHELRARGLPVNEDNERAVREELRRELGLGAYAIKLEPEIRACAEKGDTVLDGLYSWQEFVHLKEVFGDRLIILAVVTNRAIRYERLRDRPVRPLTAEMATKRDYTEIENLAKGGPISIADWYLDNNGDEAALEAQVKAFLAAIGRDA